MYNVVGGDCTIAAGKTGTKMTSACVSACKSTDNSNPTTDACFQKSVLASADVLFVTSSSGACNTMGDGFLAMFSAFGLIGAFYFIVVCVGIRGGTSWDKSYYQAEEGTGVSMSDISEPGKTSDA